MDIIKFIVAAVVLIAGIVGYEMYSETSVLYSTLGIVAAFVISAFIAGSTKKGKTLLEFIGASRQEIRRIVWPTKKETNQTTIIVVIAVFVLGLLLWLMDSALVFGMRFVTGS